MNTLFEKLPQYDIDMTRFYFNRYGDWYDCKQAPMEYIMRFWAQNKMPLYQMFNENFILEKEIHFTISEDELMNEMYKKIYNYNSDSKTYQFANQWEEFCYSKIRELGEWHYDAPFNRARHLLSNSEDLVDNEYHGTDFTIEYNGKKIVVQNGCKIVKMIGKLSKLFGIPDELYEDFRITHSMVLNQKKIKGTLCLSIHPMDYITMSDNDHGWSSCMSWIDDPGDYRLGTIEMMNSPYVVVAYLKSNNDELYLNDEFRWNSKRWRQLLVVSPDLILGNKQYPYNNDELQGTAMKWLRELALATHNYGPYSETAINIENRADNYIDGNKAVHFNLDMDYMYNDIYDFRLAYFNPNYKKSDYSLFLSGPAVCIACGDVIESHQVEPCRVVCQNCSGEARCCSCGDWHSIDDLYHVDGHYYCSYCYDDLYSCDVCGARFDGQDSGHSVVYINTCVKGYAGNFNWKYGISICGNCDDPQEYEDSFGEMLEMENEWNWIRKVFDVKNLTDEAIDILQCSQVSKKYIREMREASTLKEAEAVDEKYFSKYSPYDFF